MNRAYTGAIGRGRAAQTDLAATGRIADALSVPLMTLPSKSTLNVGSDSGLSTVELGDRSRAWPPVTLDVIRGPTTAHFSEAAAIPLRCLDENPSSQAADIGLRASGDRLGRKLIFATKRATQRRIGECNAERPAEHANER